jgi:four helix bundle protein
MPAGINFRWQLPPRRHFASTIITLKVCEMELKSHKDLLVYQKSVALVLEVYALTSSLPSEEKYGLVSQIRRAAVSIPVNISEGASRQSKKEYIQFLFIALGSASELETLFEITSKLGHVEYSNEELVDKVDHIKRMLKSLIKSLKGSPNIKNPT